MRDTRCWMLDARHWMLDTGYKNKSTFSFDLMKFLLTSAMLLIAFAASAQWSSDTIIDYNGRKAKMKIEFNREGEKTKETVFHANGKIQTEYFYADNKNVHWIAYDSTGIVVAEWEDPEIANSIRRQSRNLILTIVSVLIALSTWLLYRWKGYERTYLVIVYSTIFVTITTFLLQRRVDTESLSESLKMVIASILWVLPMLSLIFSVSNFFRKTEIGLVVSVVVSLFCLWILVIYTVAALTAGAGILS